MQSSVSSRLIILGLMLAITTDVQAEIKTIHKETATHLNSTVPTIEDTETTARTSNKKNESITQYPNETNPVGDVLFSTTISTTHTGKRTVAASTTPLPSVSSTTRAETSVTTSTQESTTTQDNLQDKAGFIILGAFIIAIILIVIIIVFLRKKTRRYSFDLYRKNHEDAGIPLSTVEGEGAFEAIASKENSCFDNGKEEKVVNDTKASPKTSTSGNGQEKPEIVSNPGEEAKKPEDEVTELPEDFSQVIFTPENTSIVFNLETNDSDTSQSSKTSVESLEDQKNENNNNSVAGRLASNSSCNPFYGNPSFSVVTYRKNESSLESERSVWKTSFCLDDSQATNNTEDVIVGSKIAPTVNGEEGRAPCSGDWPEGAEDSCFTEIQLRDLNLMKEDKKSQKTCNKEH
ncbi:hypothetical protein AOXY_G593 [Acipenser oxyrinchus oxyrinchus]|uniref:Uncharacterized protein n=1 Tax=Acipenser oxyrinchus oxyrinchus TaxID=40147 RepID=A0AAD8GKV2_ACIOX|nr:hypothetical protein AOXY_G593 [Acipenser oxyrinchus oxyrinchus]